MESWPKTNSPSATNYTYKVSVASDNSSVESSEPSESIKTVKFEALTIHFHREKKRIRRNEEESISAPKILLVLKKLGKSIETLSDKASVQESQLNSKDEEKDRVIERIKEKIMLVEKMKEKKNKKDCIII